MATWKEMTTANPAHSENYAQRWKIIAAQGNDIHGEARLIDAIADRESRILDAGCGTGRLGGELIRRGHEVVGTDVDEILINHAKTDHPDGTWYVGDLSVDPIPEDNFDIAVSAGNVMGFLAEDGRKSALENIFRALRPGGRFVVGFGAGRGWSFMDFLGMAEEVGFAIDHRFSSWDLEVFDEDSNFLVAFLRVPSAKTLI